MERLKALLGTQIHENKNFFFKNFDFRPPPAVNISGKFLGKKFQKKFFFKDVPNHLKRRETQNFFLKFFSTEA